MNNTGIGYSLQGHILFRKAITSAPKPSGGWQRGKIKSFSARSAARLRRFLRTSVSNYRTLITLTYPHSFPLCGRVAKNHLREFIRRIERHLRDETEALSVFWCLEFQERGAPHFHLAVNRDFIPHALVSRLWYEVVGSDDERHLQAGTRTERLRSGRHGLCAYFGMYASKVAQKSVPCEYEDVGRFWGVSGNRSCKSTFVFVSADFLKSEIRKEMEFQINEAAKRHGTKAIRAKNLGMTRMMYIKHESLAREIEVIMLRYGCRIVAAGEGFVEHPLMYDNIPFTGDEEQ